MCQSSVYRHSIFCILPPHILHSIALHGTQQQRTQALQTLGLDHSLRMMRVNNALMAATAARVAPHIAPVGAAPQVQRTIYDTHTTTNLPGEVVRAEGAVPTNDLAVNEAYDGLGATFKFYLEAYQRNSIDNQGLPLLATVHYDANYDNAFWNGQQMVFGDGDGQLFNRFTISLDVIGHELTHGVTQTDAKLVYQDQPGALNESVSDVFGSLVKQFALNQTADQADWLIGAGLLTGNVQGVALRSMKAPGMAYNDPVLGQDPQPAGMQNYLQTANDNGGVHINSGIPNHAFYLLATQLGGHPWERAGLIWYNTLHDPALQPTSDFKSFAQLTAKNADQLFGQGSAEGQAVRAAWNEVGIALT
jgi:Zn-dependent metalloprotease